jgi:lambda family phage portal protein
MVNNSDAKSAQNAMLNYIVGTGFDLQSSVTSTVRGPDMMPVITEFEGWNGWAEDVFLDWSNDVYLTTADNAPMAFYEFQMMALERWIQDGEVFVHYEPDRTNIMRLEFVDPEALDKYRTTGNDGNPVILGVEIEKNTMRPLAYWVLRSQVTDIDTYLPGDSVRIPANRIIHAYIRKYPRQLRGIPWMSAVIERINQTDSYRTAQLIRNKIAAFFGILFTGDGSTGRKMFNDNEGNGSNFPVDPNGNPITTLSPGIMGSLPPGVTPSKIDPTSPETQYHEFMRSLLSSCGSGIEFGMSYQLLSRDTTGLSFAGGRLVTQMDAQGFRPAQRMFTNKLLSPLYRAWMEFAVLSGALTSSGYSTDPKFWTRHEWLPSGWNFGVNPLQEVNASSKSMESNITTLVDECSRLGLDWKAQLRKGKKVKDYAASLGINLGAIAPAPQPDEEDAEFEEQSKV